MAWLALFAAPAAADTPAPALTPRPCLLKAAPGMTPDALFRTPERFDCEGRQNDAGPGDFWVLMQGFSTVSKPYEPQQLRWASVWQKRLTLHFHRADGSIATLGLTSKTISAHIQLGAEVAVDLPPHPSPVTAILVHVEGAGNVRGVFLSPQIESRSAGDERTLVLTALYAACGGIALALLAYNLMLWSALGLRVLLFYCAMVLATALYGISSSGILAWLVPWIDNNDRLRINYLLLSLTASAALVFIGHFFEDSVYPPWLRRAIAAAAATVLAAGLAFALLAPLAIRPLDLLYSISYLGLLAVIPPLIHAAWRAQSRMLNLFLIAWSAPFLFASVRIAHGFGLVPHHFWIDNSTLLAMSIEALLSSFAVAYRIRALSDERDHARQTAEAARELADIDPLTGLLNRRAFLRRILSPDYLGRRCRLLLIDVDHFKRINDRLGHDTGDEVLCRLAALLREAANADTLTVRLGGEEFGLLSRIEDAGITPDALLARTRSAIMPHGAKVTLSIGVAEGEIGGEADWQTLYRRADVALYRAKQTGRDRTCKWTEMLGDVAA